MTTQCSLPQMEIRFQANMYNLARRVEHFPDLSVIKESIRWGEAKFER